MSLDEPQQLPYLVRLGLSVCSFVPGDADPRPEVMKLDMARAAAIFPRESR